MQAEILAYKRILFTFHLIQCSFTQETAIRQFLSHPSDCPCADPLRGDNVAAGTVTQHCWMSPLWIAAIHCTACREILQFNWAHIRPPAVCIAYDNPTPPTRSTDCLLPPRMPQCLGRKGFISFIMI